MVFIQSMNNISFTSQLTKNMTIQCRNGASNCSDKSVSIVELDRHDSRDLDALYAIGEDWSKQGFNYAPCIFTSAASDKDESDWMDKIKEHYIALTLQEDNFDKLDPKKILGLSLLSEYKYDNEIDFLQVKPTNSYSKVGTERKYKKIGTTMLDYIKSISQTKPIYVNSAVDAVDFYEMNDFKRILKNDPTQLCYNA